MKKGKWILASLLVLFTLTGCGQKELTCTTEESTMGVEMKNTITAKFKGDKLNHMKVSVDVTLPDSLKEQKKKMMESFKNDSSVKEAKIKETKNGFKVEGSANAKDLGTDEKAKYDDVKKALEKSGYKCK